MKYRNSFFVITGGPGAGKTTLVEALKRQGFRGVDEPGRRIIQTQTKFGGRAIPWLEPELYAEVELAVSISNFLGTNPAETTFFDRGIADVIGLLVWLKLPVPAYVIEAARRLRYNATAFIAPAWEDIYVTDEERPQSFSEASTVYDAMIKAYTLVGYNLIHLPRSSVSNRVNFVRGVLMTNTD
ncbi:AAA family ATPase [Rhizobium puerariae]|uniref:AAA family ATPase n=1 Tax=Rhizobium puerariae TaxID=1585791 RepID=A0ABV6AG17_9HYPH